jgi:hypothetical protein
MNRWCLGTAVLKAGSPSFESVARLKRAQQAPKEGTTAAAWRPARGVPQAGFAAGSRPRPYHPHNEHPRAGYRTAEPSDSPPRASRYALTAA